MIEKNVIISVRGEQYFEDIDPDTVELTSEGRMTIRDDGEIILAYDETELTGMEGTTTELIFMQNEPTLVTLRRTGTVRCALVMEEHKQHSGVYETPVMPLDLTVTTHSLINTITEDGGYMEAYYSLRFGTVTTTRTRLKVEVLLG